MCTEMSEFGCPRRKARRSERGVALILVLLTLLLLSAIGLGMMYMSDTETAVGSNYRDTQLAFFAMRAGLEEARDRMRASSIAYLNNLPTTMPGTAGSILYLTNPSAGEVVTPTNSANQYFDDEFCHENFSSAPATGTLNVPCGASQGPPTTSVVYAAPASIAPNTGTAASMKYKWVRITLKQNGTFANGNAANRVDPSQADGQQICFQTLANQEIPASLVPGGPFATCAAAQAAGADANPVYIVTSLAVTPQGSRRIGQYEVAAFDFVPPGGALGLDGPAATYSKPSSSGYAINGNDSGTAGYTGPPGTCPAAPGPAVVPAISTGDAAGVTNVDTAITTSPDRSGNYTGTPPPAPASPTPSVVNEGSGGGGLYSGGWSSPAALDYLVTTLSSQANVTYPAQAGVSSCWTSACPIVGSLGTDAAPQITYVDGSLSTSGLISGSGVLIVTGTLSLGGNFSFNGLILVIGQGVVNMSGGGSGQFNGTLFVAKTRGAPSPAPGPELSTLGTPSFSWAGGGGNGIRYNSCWSHIGNNLSYGIVAMREEMY
jgi:hypothetical protein